MAFDEVVAEVSRETIKKYVEEGIGNIIRKSLKRSKRKQVIITTGLFLLISIYNILIVFLDIWS